MGTKDSDLFQSGLGPGQETPPTMPARTPGKKRRKGSRLAAPLGFGVLLLCIIGIITLIVAIVNITQSFINNDKEKARFEKMLIPVVMYDPPPFESVATLDQPMLLQTAMWSAILNNDDSKWAKDELDFSLIPASELDVRAANLYGPGVKPEHQTFGDYETTYLYDEQNKVYSVPPTAEVALYTPKVEKITKNGDEIILLVGYVPPGSVWEIDENGNRYQPDPDKYMNYFLQKTDGGYILTALRDVEKSEDDSSSGSASFEEYEEDLINADDTSSLSEETFGDESEPVPSSSVASEDVTSDNADADGAASDASSDSSDDASSDTSS
ncbi:MAG: hypothetical protein ACERKO_02950 [Acetanaerobacterium sp.]